MERFLGAETVLKVIRLAHRPVLALPGTVEDLPHQAVVAVDFSPFSLHAARAAFTFLKSPGRVHLLHVMSGLDGVPEPAGAWREAYREEVEDRLRAVRRELPLPDEWTISTTVRSGTPGDETTETASPTPEPGKALLWHSRTEADIKALEEDLETFAENTVHSVEHAKIADLVTKSNSAIPSGNGPQLFEWAHDLGGDYWERGFLTDQSGKVDIDLESTYTSSAVSAATWNGNLIGLPFAAETVALVYNKDLVDEPPETLSEMKTIMEEHHEPANNQYGLGYNIDPYFISAWPHTFGGYYYAAEADELGLARKDTHRGFRIVIDDL
jgi:hypothetical protein